MGRVILTGDSEISLYAVLQLYFKRLVLVPLKTVVIRNSLSNPSKKPNKPWRDSTLKDCTSSIDRTPVYLMDDTVLLHKIEL